jgi:hypothetical protein
LAVDITADGHRAAHRLHVGLVEQNLAGLSDAAISTWSRHTGGAADRDSVLHIVAIA